MCNVLCKDVAELQGRGNLARNEEGIGDRWAAAESRDKGSWQKIF
jgi:hypothetical protein